MINYQFSKKTVASKFKRLAYFNGQLLTENDLLEEQDYIREKLKMHNRLHGTGVIRGLEVVQLPVTESVTIGESQNAFVTINPGFALDCDGNEVIVCKMYPVDLSESVDYLKRIGVLLNRKNNCIDDKCSDLEPHITIGIVYGECNSNLTTQYMTTCTTDIQEQHSRTREGFRVVIGLEYESTFNLLNAEGPENICTTTTMCKSQEMDYSEDMIIPLARVCISSTAVCPIVKIVDKRQFAWTADTQREWEKAREMLMRSGKQAERDISNIVNRNVDDVKKMLEQKKMTVSQRALLPSELTEEEYGHVKRMSSIVPEGSEVTLITDQYGKKVLFGFVRKSRSDQNNK